MKLDNLAQAFGAEVAFSIRNSHEAATPVADCAGPSIYDCPNAGFVCPMGFICEYFLCLDYDCTGAFLCVAPFGCGSFGCIGSYCGSDIC